MQSVSGYGTDNLLLTIVCQAIAASDNIKQPPLKLVYS